MLKPVNKNPPGMLYQGEQKEKKGAYFYSCWIFQILVWIAILLVVFFLVTDNKAKKLMIVVFGFLYFIYLILEFCSATSKYLCNKSSTEGIYEKMGNYFRTPPEIKFYCECYHYEIRTYTKTNIYGKTETYTKKEKVVSYTEDYFLPYYSERDVSGLFYLNCDKINVKKKHFIKLKLREEINFADSLSYMDYVYEKDYFWRRNRFRDVYFDFKEERIIPGMVHHNLIKMTDDEPCSVNFLLFFFFTILTFSEFYKLYVNSFCVYQKFKIRKIVSTRYDLNQPVYQNLIPKINIITQEFNYQPQDYNHLNTGYEVKLPTKEEIERAKQYQNKIPDYQISSGNGNIQAGVIVDNPSYSNYDANSPPPAFASLGGNVPLDPNQINQNINMPPEFEKPDYKINVPPSNENEDKDADEGSQQTTLQPYLPTQ